MSAIVDSAHNIKYVYVELTLNKEHKYDTVTGLFMGVIERNKEKFILVHGMKDTVAVLNTKFYGIVTVEVLKDSYRDMLYLKKSEDDQKMGLQLLEELYDLLLKNDFGMKNDAKILDVDKYKNVPDRYKDTTVDYSAPAGGFDSTTTTTTSTTTKATTTYNYGTGTNNYYTTVKKDPQPAVLGRTKSKKPTKAELDTIQEKLDQIKAGTFAIEFPEIAEKKEAIEETQAANNRAVNYYSGIDDDLYAL